jgi:arsenite methyltransferase
MTLKQLVEERYNKEIEETNLGCANISCFLNFLGTEKVLDLGCGKGYQVFSFAKKLKEGKVYGLDSTTKMIEYAKANHLLPNTEYTVGDIHSLPYSSNYFDIITSNCVINHSLNKKQVFSEIYRVLNTNGYFIIADVMSETTLPELVSNNLQNVAECWGGAIMKNEYLEIVKEIGFLDLEILSSRKYKKNEYNLESIVLKGVKK